MHSQKENTGRGMFWGMLICCSIPLVLIFLFGVGAKAIGLADWIILGVLAVFLIGNFFMRYRSISGSEHSHENVAEQGKEKSTGQSHSDHSCCH